MMGNGRKSSAFLEAGLDNDGDVGGGEEEVKPKGRERERPQSVRFRSQDEVYTIARVEEEDAPVAPAPAMNMSVRPLRPLVSPVPDGGRAIMYRLGAFLLLLAGVFPLLQNLGLLSHGSIGIRGVKGGPIPGEMRSRSHPFIEPRQDSSSTDVCFRWAQQSAVVNGTLYLYGGQATNETGQEENTWNNNLLKLDLTKSWQIGSPTLESLPQPSGPPSVALGYLFNDHDSLYLYGGQFSWKPPASPVPFSTWEYNIASGDWTEHSDPVTSGGNSAPSNGEDVQRSAEGAGVNIPTLGRGYYFGGHQDGYTTPGWSQSIWRIYLQSMLEFTFPGYANSQVDSLGDGKTAGDEGVYRNITNGGLQSKSGFTARADGILAYVPGYGDEGILLALAGGTNETFTQMNNVNVYDIATSSWYTQATSGETPEIRVNPCSVVAASQDGTSHNVYMWGGQNLIPAGNQTQFSDMWILSVPSFKWVKVDQEGQSVPYGRSGHTCNIWNGQLISVGGYVGDQLSCESPGIYVFDLSSLEWVQQFTALSPGVDDGSSDGGDSDGSDASEKSGSTGANNPFNQQPEQIASGDNPGGLYGSYGYQVPEAVYKVIGGGGTGGATITTPAATATAGPMATGSATIYTVTRPDGSTVTESSSSGSGSPSGNGSSGAGNNGGGGPNIAAIVVGTVCGVLLIVIAYLLFCLYLYRKQLALYKNHVEMSQRQARGEKPPAIPGLWTTTSESAKSSSDRRRGEGQPFLAAGGEGGSQAGSGGPSSGPGRSGLANQSADQRTTSSARSSTDDLLAGQEPTFVGVLLNPRRSLKVVNRD